MGKFVMRTELKIFLARINLVSDIVWKIVTIASLQVYKKRLSKKVNIKLIINIGIVKSELEVRGLSCKIPITNNFGTQAVYIVDWSWQ